MNINKLISILIISTILTTSLFSKEQKKRLKVAVIDLKAMGVSETTGSILSETLRSKLFNLKKFEVMNRQDMQSLFEEKAFQQSGVCDDTECIVEMGLVLGVEKVVSGSIGKLGETFSVTLKLVDVETAKNEVIVNKTEKCDEDYLFTLIKALAEELTNYEKDNSDISENDKNSNETKKSQANSKKKYDLKTQKMIGSLTKRSRENKKLDIMLNAGVPFSSLKLKWYVWRGLFISSSIGGGSRKVSSTEKYENYSDDNFHSLYLETDGNESAFEPIFEFEPFKFGAGYQIFDFWSIDLEVFGEIGTHDEEHKFTIDLMNNNDELLANCDYKGETSGVVVDIGLTIDRVFKYNIHFGLDLGYSFSDDINYRNIDKSYSDDVNSENREFIDEAAEDYKLNLKYRSVLARLVLGWKF